jgi:hypothetical protein
MIAKKLVLIFYDGPKNLFMRFILARPSCHAQKYTHLNSSLLYRNNGNESTIIYNRALWKNKELEKPHYKDYSTPFAPPLYSNDVSHIK